MVAERTTGAVIRDELEALIVRDLHGPFGGDEELLPAEPLPRDRYLVGMLAPRRSIVDPRRFDAATIGTQGEAPTEDKVPAPQTMPSSLGLTFLVPASARELIVTASWGRYAKEDRDPHQVKGLPGFDVEDGADVVRVWKRYSMSGRLTVRLDVPDGELSSRAFHEHYPGVVLRGRIRRAGNARLVTLFLVNEQPAPDRNIDIAWLFQASLSVAGADGSPVFLDRSAVLGDETASGTGDDASLAMLYRNQIEFAVGHGTAVHATPSAQHPTRAVRLVTVNVPRYEVPRTDAPSIEELPALAGLELDMKRLAHISEDQVAESLSRLVIAYRDWIAAQRRRIDDPDTRLQEHAAIATSHLGDAERAANRIAAGIALLERDPLAREAFRFANDAMWRQRVHQLAVLERLAAPVTEHFDIGEALARLDTPENHSWRVFQLAFLLLNLPALTDQRHPERSAENGIVDLLFFPTGGGKTEAYLGLAAYTFAIRRLQGTMESDAGPLDGSGGVAVLMRYTLRLLTAQQFQRAASLVAACEIIRRERVANDPRWGSTPFRLGLYIGGTSTPNSTDEAHGAIENARQRSGKTGSYADPLKIVNCPWCGTRLSLASDAYADKVHARTLFYCADESYACPFTQKNSPGEGLPIVTVDEEIYRLLPGFVIATVDKFAQLPWRGPMHTLFGRVSRRCQRHGYRSPDLKKVGNAEEKDSHNATETAPKAITVDCNRLRPPDLIVQDELHLISGPLGTLVGLYETAIDRLASASFAGAPARPKVIASTATIRRAPQQVQAIFDRELRVFPPPGLDVEDSFFARARTPSTATPGRCYLGIAARGLRMKAAETRVAITVLAAAQAMLERYGKDADPYMTLLGYFSSIRELAGMRRLLDDDIRMRLPRATQRGLARRPTPLHVRELTSRISGDEIIDVLARLGQPHDPADPQKGDNRPLDVVLATNMISVGVDVPRLGLMVVSGQPKSTAEYIQASSRVGRNVAGPGLVITLFNWNRPRDLSHYERFEHDHATFYRQVEPLSVTPFAERALDRGLTAVLVGLVRHENADRDLGPKTNPDPAAQHVPTTSPQLQPLHRYLRERAADVTTNATGDLVRQRVEVQFDDWLRRQHAQVEAAVALSYSGRSGTQALLNDGLSMPWNRWSAPNSLRDVEREINFLLDPVDENLGGAAPFALATAPVPMTTSFEDEPAETSETGEP